MNKIAENLNETLTPKLGISDVSESIFDKAVKHVQETFCDAHLSTPYMLLGDVAELIKITTGKEVDWNLLAKYSRKRQEKLELEKRIKKFFDSINKEFENENEKVHYDFLIIKENKKEIVDNLAVIKINYGSEFLLKYVKKKIKN